MFVLKKLKYKIKKNKSDYIAITLLFAGGFIYILALNHLEKNTGFEIALILLFFSLITPLLSALLVIYLLITLKNIINKVRWKRFPHQAPLHIISREGTKQIIINCKERSTAREYISSPVSINVVGLEGLAYFARKGDVKIRERVLSILELSNFKEVNNQVTDSSKFVEELLRNIPPLEIR